MKYSHETEREYYSSGWPKQSLNYRHLEPYITSWLKSPDKLFHGRTVLDIGAGEATYTRMIADVFQPKLIVACELFLERILPAARATPRGNVAYVSGDCFNLPFPAHCFDVVFGSLVLSQLPDLDIISREISRVLKPGGYYAGIEPNVINPIILYRFLFGKRSRNQFLFREGHLVHFHRENFDTEVSYFYWKWPRFRSPFVGTCMGLLFRKATEAKEMRPTFP